MIRGRAKGNERTSIQPKRSESVADALLRLGRDGAAGLTKFLEGGPLAGADACELIIDGLGLCFHWWCGCPYYFCFAAFLKFFLPSFAIC